MEMTKGGYFVGKAEKEDFVGMAKERIAESG
jgi:hypothetical protein